MLSVSSGDRVDGRIQLEKVKTEQAEGENKELVGMEEAHTV